MRDRRHGFGPGRPADGQGERDAKPVRVVQAGLGGAVVGSGDGVDDSQPEAGPGRAARRRAAPVEAVEDAGELGRGTPGPSSLISMAMAP